MFKLIYSSEQIFNKDLIDPFLRELRSRCPDLSRSFSDLENANFILAKANKNMINGGAVLVKRKAETLHPLIREKLEAYIPPDEEVWVGTIALELSLGISGQDFECFSKIFYRKLYEALITYGKKETTSFLCLTLPPCEHLASDLMEFWPYVLEVRPKRSGDGLYHSILSLSGTRDESPLFWMSLSRNSKGKDLAA